MFNNHLHIFLIKKYTANSCVYLSFNSFLLIIRRFSENFFFINNLLNRKNEEINNSDRVRFNDLHYKINRSKNNS